MFYSGECYAAGMYAEQLEEVLSHSAGKCVAGFIAEVIQVFKFDFLVLCILLETFFFSWS